METERERGRHEAARVTRSHRRRRRETSRSDGRGRGRRSNDNTPQKGKTHLDGEEAHCAAEKVDKCKKPSMDGHVPG